MFRCEELSYKCLFRYTLIRSSLFTIFHVHFPTGEKVVKIKSSPRGSHSKGNFHTDPK